MATHRPKIEDVATLAGVSIATVDRVLNRRSGVRAETRERVEGAASALGYSPDPAASALARRALLRFTLLLPQPVNSFLQSVHDHAARALEWLAPRGVRGTVRTIDRHDAVALAAAIRQAAAESQGIIVMALDDPRVREAIDAATDTGVAVVTLVSDCPGAQRLGFAGIDNVASGRTAGAIIGRFVGGRTGTIAVMLGSRRLRDHAERVLGLHQAMVPEFPNVTLLPEIEGVDRAENAHRLLVQCLAERPDIVGVYNAGAGNRGLIAALRESGRAGDVVFVAHELTPITREALLDGTMHAAINQDASHELRSAARQLLAFLAHEPLVPEQERIRIEIYIRENLP